MANYHPETYNKLKEYHAQGASEEQLKDWLKQARVGFMDRMGMMGQLKAEQKANLKEIVIQEKTLEQQRVTAQKTHNPNISIDFSKFQEPTQTYTPQREKKWYDWKGRRQQRLENKHPDKTVIARIKLKNGFIRNFVVVEKNGGFIHQESFYIFDNVSKEYDIDAKLWVYEYHEEYCLPIETKIEKVSKKIMVALPIKKDFPVLEIREALIASGSVQTEFASHPRVLHFFLISRIAEKILMGLDEDAFFRFIKLLTIINTCILAALLLIQLFNSDFFSKLGSG